MIAGIVEQSGLGGAAEEKSEQREGRTHRNQEREADDSMSNAIIGDDQEV